MVVMDHNPVEEKKESMGVQWYWEEEGLDLSLQKNIS